MLHKILDSYYNNDPYDDDLHPDGHLWLVTTDELDDLPDGTRLETIDCNLLIKGKHDIPVKELAGTASGRQYLSVGIRGWKDD